ncbi:MAG TPA: DUF4266 domain-containing protein [Opitutaceae bacterium]|jgi:hypothetical protein
MKTKFIVFLAAAGLAALFSGCTNPALVKVQPWERGTLASAEMDPGRDALASAQLEHVYFSREAANGGPGVGGSGCGCN